MLLITYRCMTRQEVTCNHGATYGLGKGKLHVIAQSQSLSLLIGYGKRVC